MITLEQLLQLQNNPEFMNKLINSELDPNAAMASAPPAGGTPFTPMTPTPSPVPPGAPPQAVPDAWGALGGLSTMGQGQQRPPPAPAGPMPNFGAAPKAPAPGYLPQVRPTRSQGIGELLAGMKR